MKLFLYIFIHSRSRSRSHSPQSRRDRDRGKQKRRDNIPAEAAEIGQVLHITQSKLHLQYSVLFL